MPFDGIVTKAAVTELNENIVSGRISKIYQPTTSEIVLAIRSNRKTYNLVISTHPSYARFHLTNEKYINPQEAPMFCMVLRKHLAGSVIEDIEQKGLERIITFKLRSVDEIGDTAIKYLVLELMGRHSNLLLLNEDKTHIIDSMKHISPSQNRYRSILPGQPYTEAPAQEKLHLLEVTGEDIVKKIDFNAGKLDQQLVNVAEGISPFIAREVIHRMGFRNSKAFIEKTNEFIEDIKENQFSPAIYVNEKEDFHVIAMESLQASETFSSTNEMLDQFYSGKAERDRVKQQAKDLYRFIKNELDKNIRKQKIHERTLDKAKNAAQLQRLGELLTAHMHLIKPGEESVTVVDYYDPEQKEVTISLQPNKSPSENAQIFFTKYRKLQNSQKIVQKEMEKTEAEITYLEQLLQQIDVARVEDIEEIREELREEGYLRKQKRKKKNKLTKPLPEEYISTNGITILVGKNNKQNDYLTNRVAHRNDIWLHTKDIPGSHVVIRSDQPDEQTLEEAAQLAAFFSKAQQSSSVPVDYTLVRHVKKPNGAKPGFVTYDNQKTIFVTPNPTVVKERRVK